MEFAVIFERSEVYSFVTVCFRIEVIENPVPALTAMHACVCESVCM